MSWRTAFTNLAAVNVLSVSLNCDLDDVPTVLPAADLPALLPSFPESVRDGRTDAQGLSALTCDGAAWLASLQVDHTLYWCPVSADRGPLAVMSALVTAVDGYLAALSADGTLNGSLHAPLEVLWVQIGLFEHGGTTYYGARFRHRWRLTVEVP